MARVQCDGVVIVCGPSIDRQRVCCFKVGIDGGSQSPYDGVFKLRSGDVTEFRKLHSEIAKPKQQIGVFGVAF